MFLKPSKKLFYSSAVLIVLAITAVVIYPSDPIDYNTEVKPILNKKCITCHGGVKQEGGFSLLFEEEAFAPTKSGKPAIIKFKPEESELIRRLHLTDPEDRMPYKHDPLSKEEIKIIKENYIFYNQENFRNTREYKDAKLLYEGCINYHKVKNIPFDFELIE